MPGKRLEQAELERIAQPPYVAGTGDPQRDVYKLLGHIEYLQAQLDEHRKIEALRKRYQSRG